MSRYCLFSFTSLAPPCYCLFSFTSWAPPCYCLFSFTSWAVCTWTQKPQQQAIRASFVVSPEVSNADPDTVTLTDPGCRTAPWPCSSASWWGRRGWCRSAARTAARTPRGPQPRCRSGSNRTRTRNSLEEKINITKKIQQDRKDLLYQEFYITKTF